jgi:hypothetical protein
MASLISFTIHGDIAGLVKLNNYDHSKTQIQMLKKIIKTKSYYCYCFNLAVEIENIMVLMRLANHVGIILKPDLTNVYQNMVVNQLNYAICIGLLQLDNGIELSNSNLVPISDEIKSIYVNCQVDQIKSYLASPQLHDFLALLFSNERNDHTAYLLNMAIEIKLAKYVFIKLDNVGPKEFKQIIVYCKGQDIYNSKISLLENLDDPRNIDDIMYSILSRNMHIVIKYFKLENLIDKTLNKIVEWHNLPLTGSEVFNSLIELSKCKCTVFSSLVHYYKNLFFAILIYLTKQNSEHSGLRFVLQCMESGKTFFSNYITLSIPDEYKDTILDTLNELYRLYEFDYSRITSGEVKTMIDKKLQSSKGSGIFTKSAVKSENIIL